MEDQIKQHAIWSSLQQLSALKGNAAFVETAADPVSSWSAQHIFQFASLVEQRLGQVPTVLLSIPLLNQLQSAINPALNECNNFAANRNVGHLNNAVSHIDNQGYPYLAQIPIVAPESAKDSLGRLTDDYKHQVQGVLKTVFDDRARLQQEVAALSALIQSLNAQAQELAGTVAKQKAEALVTVQSLQATYAAKEQEFAKAFDTTQATNATRFDKELSEQRESAASDRTQTKERSDNLIRDLEGQRDHAAKIVRIVGNIGITGNYQETASVERVSADRWRLVTLGASTVSVVVGAAALFYAHEVDVRLTVARILFAFLVLGVTVYTGKESARHRSNADRAKRVELELASLGPFIESLDKSAQDELRKKLTDQYFGKDGEPHSYTPMVEPTQLVDLLKSAISALKK
jgi:hypothetical protein